MKTETYKLPSAESRAWAAGFLDGEGCWSYVNASHRDIGLFATQSGKDGRKVLQKLQCILGRGKIYGPYHPGGNRQDVYRFGIFNFEDMQFALCLVWEQLGEVKKKQAKFKFKNIKPTKTYKTKKENGDI